jgi:translation elongation factor P/translation initiation factor 5A
MKTNALDLRRGNLVSHEGRICEVIHWNILKNDRRQFVQMRIKDLETGRIAEFKEHGDSKWEILENSVVEVSHSYRDGNDEVFYSEDGEEHRCPVAAAADALRWPAEAYRGLLVEGHLVAVSPPASVVVRVKETAPPIRGGGSGLKDAVLENGVKVRVNLLVDVGDRVRIDPVSLEFKERVAG